MSEQLRIERNDKSFPTNYNEKIQKVVEETFNKLRKNITKRILEEDVLNEEREYKILSNNYNLHQLNCSVCKIKEIYGNVYQCLLCDNEFLCCEKCSNKDQKSNSCCQKCRKCYEYCLTCNNSADFTNNNMIFV